MIQADIKVKLVPRSSRNQIMGMEGEALKIKLTAPPVEGRANSALIALMARTLKLPKSSIEILSGKTSRLKTIRIRGLSQEEVHKLLLPS